MLTRKNSTTFLLFLLCLLSGKLNFLFAQEVWSLEKCIERGIEKNLGLKGTELGLQNRMVSLREARLQQLPTLNASVNYGLSIGRNIDPTTNAFVTQNILFGNYGISAGLPVYQGGFVQNNIKYNRALTEASARDYEQAVNDLSLNIAGLYLSVLLADERVEISRKNLETVTAQRKNMERLVEIGSRAAADALEINAQEARAEQTLISAQNNAEQARLQLRQQLRLESAAVLVLQRPDDASFRNIENESYTAEQLYQIALGNQPGIQSAERNVMAADIQKNMARAAYFPRTVPSATLIPDILTQPRRPLLSPIGLILSAEISMAYQSLLNLSTRFLRTIRPSHSRSSSSSLLDTISVWVPVFPSLTLSMHAPASSVRKSARARLSWRLRHARKI